MMKMKNILFCSLLFPAMALSGCTDLTGNGYMYAERATINHPIKVEPSQKRLQVWSDQRGHLFGNQGEIRNFTIEFARKGHGPIWVEGSSSDIRTASALLVKNGVNPSDIRMVRTENPTSYATLSYQEYQARPDACGKFQSDNYPLFSNFWNNTNSEFGCATQHNLAAMISDPLDLVKQRSQYEISDAPLVGRFFDYQTYAQPPAPEKQSASR